MLRAWLVLPNWLPFDGTWEVLEADFAACSSELQEQAAHPEHWVLVATALEIVQAMAHGMYAQSSTLHFLCAPAVMVLSMIPQPNFPWTMSIQLSGVFAWSGHLLLM
jgi:hypothetical protein